MKTTTQAPREAHGTTAGIRTEALSKAYVTKDQQVLAMADVDLDIAPGEFVAVVGASGCGKSTLLRILAGFDRPSAGRAIVGGTEVRGPSADRGVVFQDYGLFPWMTVRENVQFGPRQRRRPRAEIKRVAAEFIDVVGLARFADKYPGQLSGGMQQRVAIARVLANSPSVMLMDEPFGALDALTRSELQEELRRIHRVARTTVVFVTHSIEEAVFLADRVVVMAGGASHGVPGHVADIVSINLPGDRDRTGVQFNEYERRLATLVHAS